MQYLLNHLWGKNRVRCMYEEMNKLSQISHEDRLGFIIRPRKHKSTGNLVILSLPILTDGITVMSFECVPLVSDINCY